MARFRCASLCIAVTATLLSLAVPAAQAEDPSEIAPNADTVLLMIFLKQTQELNLEQMGKKLRANGFFKKFPPEGVKIVGWYMLMSVGHLVILEVPPAKLRELNRAIEATAYGVFRSEVHPSYDFLPVITRIKERQRRNE